MDFTEQTLQSTYHYRGMVNLRSDRVRLPDGNESSRVVVEHPGATAIVAIDEQDRVVLVEQYRYPVKDLLLEIPAGKLDPGEDPETCARRELLEEVGLRATEMVHLGTYFTSPGFCNEVLHLYWARGEKTPNAPHDVDEFLRVVTMDPAEILKMAVAGRLGDAKTVCAVLVAAARGLLPGIEPPG